MDSTNDTPSELNLKILWESLKYLTKLSSHDESKELKDLRGAFQLTLRKTVALLEFKEGQKIPLWKDTTQCGSGLIWDFVEVALFILLNLNEKTCDIDLSVSQQKEIRSCLQFIVSLGIKANILPGVICKAADNDALRKLFTEDEATIIQKYERLCIVVDAVLMCCGNPNIRPLIISNVLHQLLGALFQLSFAPLKKPLEQPCLAVDTNFTMTMDVWKKLQEDRQHYRNSLDKLVRETYQPKVMFELMILLGNQGEYLPPKWLQKSTSNILTSCLIQPGGVTSLIQATFDSSPDIGNDWKKIETIANIVTSPVNNYSSIASQLLKLVQVSYNSSPQEMNLVAVVCIKHLLNKDISICKKLVIEPLLQPITDVFASRSSLIGIGTVLLEEEKLDSVVRIIHLCFATTTSQIGSARLPGTYLVPISSFFFKLFCKVDGSVSHLCQFTEDILHNIFCDCDPDAMTKVLRCVLLEEEDENVLVLPGTYTFNFGQTGGLCLEVCTEPSKDLFSSSVEDSGDKLMVLLEKRNDTDLLYRVFESLIKILVGKGMKPKQTACNQAVLETVEDALASLMSSSEKHLGIVRLLAALVENSVVKQKLTENPGPVLSFIGTLLESQILGDSLEEEEDLELVFVAFMILNVILDSCGEATDWSLFTKLLQPVAAISSRSTNSELKRLASRVYSAISSCGVLYDTEPSKTEVSQKSRCEEALHDACDPLLPVRGHAIVQLTRLVQQRDPETLAKKDAVLCIFKENLNNSDSYIYLAAINGMVAFASIQADEAVTSLIQEYISISSLGDDSNRDPELRMKVGEIMVKLVRELGNLAPKYKNELLNAFLVGSKDVDHLMRASSLSNLGEVCQIFGFRIGPVLGELLLCIQSILRFDKAIEPRRASLMVVTQLLRGIEADTFNVLEDIVLELYRTLKWVYNEDQDDVVRLHAQLALEELGRLAKDFIFPKLPMNKKIQVLPQK